jgi:outer membrane protein assembly factor BamB
MIPSGALADTAVRWSLERGIPEIPSPLLYRGRLYTVQDGGLLRCLDPETGREFYRERLGPLGRYSASPIAADGRIYLVSATGTVVVAKAGDTFQKLAQSSLGEPVMATPALVGDRIYLRSGKHLWAFATRH